MHRARYVFTLILFLVLLPSHGAEARTHRKQRLPSATASTVKSIPSEPSPADELRELMRKTSKSRSAKLAALGFAALDRGKLGSAKSMARKIQKDSMFSDYGFAIEAAALRKEARGLLAAKKSAEASARALQALRLLIEIEASQPYSPLLKRLPEEMASVELLAAEAQFTRKGWNVVLKNSESAFQRLANSNALNQLEPEHVERFAESCKKKPSALCPSWVHRLAGFFPRASVEAKALARVFPAAFERSRSNYGSGKGTISYKGPELDNDAFDAAFAQYLDSKYDDAAKSFQRFIDEFPRSASRYRARYWLGQALAKKNDNDAAQRVFEELLAETPLNYYGMLASLASNKAIEGRAEAAVPLALPTDDSLSPLESFRLKRAELFLGEGAPALAAEELREIKARDSLSSPFLVYLALLDNEAGSHRAAFNLLGELLARGYAQSFSSFTLRMIFPVEHWDVIQKQARALELDPVLLLGVIKQESAFDPKAGSGVGATGLMQLMPATASETDSSIRRAELVTPEASIRVGAKYLKQMMRRFNGNAVLALGAYNAGPAAMNRWLRDSKSKFGMLEFIELIPYKETREYIGAILRNYYWYAPRLGVAPPKNLSQFWNVVGPPHSPESFPAGGEASPVPPSTESESEE